METSLLMHLFIHKYGDPAASLVLLSRLWIHKELDKAYLHRASVQSLAKLLQSCPTLCDPIDGRPPGSPVPGILQARTLKWVAISFSNA